ncbi:PE family protein [Mycobacterium heidelbergense]|uniref:Uncharacterized protein n=1 Tax=Mycobacterium heidelbergense TaxID=53376 RepID=A0A1X0DI92_MYCHE|nr:PE family protein [Mycobacterium heidelbergense]MCV7050411.1 PE family protein [Mycobacterium heidelbergense]ORA71570.1 hypothetical protein BST25_16675 [Mycobacterium heidelbergense]BBZ52795.1 hypothetical protein MHEI_45120 [Mycobacterium heidelbergense]
MSFVTTAPEFVTAAADDLADIGLALRAAHAAAAPPTTGILAAAADEVSNQIAATFGAYAEEYQAVSGQAAAFHSAFVSLLNGSALGYLSTEVANAEQNLLSTMSAPAQALLGQPFIGAGPAAALPILGGSGGLLGDVSSLLFTGGPLGAIIEGGPLGPFLNGIGQDIGGVVSTVLAGGLPGLLSDPLGPVVQGLQPLLPGLFAASATAMAAGDPYQVLIANTSANLQSLFGTWSADPFPFLNQVIINQQGYAQTFGAGLALALQNLPATLANVPANIQLAIQGAATFNPGALAQAYINQQIGYVQTITTSLQSAGADFSKTVPVFEADMGMAGQALMTGDYHGAVEHVGQAVLGLFISGFDTSNLSDVKILGPGGDLLPILTIPAQQAQNFANLLPPGSILDQIAQNYANAITAFTNGNIATTITLQLLQSPPVVMGANFGLPLSLAFAAMGSPISALDGFATGATAFGSALQAGNGVAAAGALVDMPAYVLNGFLNGQTLVDLNMPVSVGGVTIPMTMHLPFDGILVAPQPLTATVDLSLLGIPVPVNLTLGGTPFEGIVPELLNYVPEQLAAAIRPA